MKLRFIPLLCASLALTAVAGVAQAAANPGGVAYRDTTNVSLYAKATGLMVPGRCNRNNSVFQTVRQKGGEVLVYIIPIAVPDNRICSIDQEFYMGNYGAVPLWPFPTYGQRILRPGNHLADIRPGSKWSNFVVAYVEKLMRERKFDGVFLDVVEERLEVQATRDDGTEQVTAGLWGAFLIGDLPLPDGATAAPGRSVRST